MKGLLVMPESYFVVVNDDCERHLSHLADFEELRGTENCFVKSMISYILYHIVSKRLSVRSIAAQWYVAIGQDASQANK
jgi:hypothetical protein